MTHHSGGVFCSNLPAHCNNKYEVFYSLWPCSCHSKLESSGDRVYLIFFIIFIMAGFDDDDFSLSGLTQEGHEFDVPLMMKIMMVFWIVLESSLEKYLIKQQVPLKGACRQVSSHVSSHMSSQVHQISRFLKQLVVDYFFQTAWHLLCHIQSNQLM